MNHSHNLTSFGNPVRAAVERALAAAGFAHLSALDRSDAAAALTSEAYGRVGLELAGHLDDSSMEEFRRLVEAGAPDDELAAFFRVRVPDLEAHVRKALAGLESEVACAADEARRAAHL